MKRTTPESPQPDPSINMNDSNMNLMLPQDPARPTTSKKHQERTIFTQEQYKKLEALFSQTMFPNKNTQKELALELNLPEITVKVWFRNRRFKWKQQQQQQQSSKQPNQILSTNMPTSSRIFTHPYSLFPVVSGFCSYVAPQSLDPSNWACGCAFTESPTNDFQMQDLQLERLVASVPALFPDSYDIGQIMEVYSFPDEDEISCSFHCLYQYLSPTRSQLGE
nr:arginine-fifty homeobox-like [Microcebus murinus]